MKVLVYGATGSQQFHVIGAAKNKGSNVFAVTSSEKHFSRLQEAGATPVLANMGDAKRIMDITKGIDAISFLIPFSLPNPLDGLQYSKNVIDAAKANSVKMVVWNTSGYLLPFKIGIPSEDLKLDVKEYLQQSGVPYIIIEPPIYAENLLAPHTVNYVKNQRMVAYPTPEQMPIGWIASKDVGALVAEALFKPELSGQSFQISGLNNLKGNDLAEKFSIGLGAKITYYAMPAGEFGDILRTFLHEEAVNGIQQYYQSLAETKDYPPKFNPKMNEVLEKLPVKLTPVEEWVKEHKDVYFN